MPIGILPRRPCFKQLLVQQFQFCCRWSNSLQSTLGILMPCFAVKFNALELFPNF